LSSDIITYAQFYTKRAIVCVAFWSFTSLIVQYSGIFENKSEQ
jgi:hypothetical protein